MRIGNILLSLILGHCSSGHNNVVGLHAQHFPSRFAYAQLERNVGRLGQQQSIVIRATMSQDRAQ